MNWKRNAVLRKSVAALRRLSRGVRRLAASPSSYSQRPPILANSFPKSGTHLLVQIVEAFPGARSYGSFLASMPSVPFRERSAGATVRRIRAWAPGEVVPAHLFCEAPYAEALTSRNAVHYFIYRDPRDVVLSEAHYLGGMNRWHRLHRYFKALPSLEDRITFSITGTRDPAFPYDYPDVARRFARYAGWLERDDVMAVRFEDLNGAAREATLRSMVEFWRHRASVGGDLDTEALVGRAEAAIRPERSHTFREGGSGGWRAAFTPGHRALMKELAGELLVKLGYEASLDW